MIRRIAPATLGRSGADGAMGEASRRDARRRAERWVLASLIGAGLVVSGGCQDASHMFGGVWDSPEPFASTFYSGKFSLAIGHFGREMTGVVHFLDADGIETTDPCKCAFLDQNALDLQARTFVVVSQRCDAGRWIWKLALDTEGDVDALVGTVEEQGGVTPTAVRFEFVDPFVSDQDMACPPP